MAQHTISRLELRNRYVFEGRLEMQAGLHIGGGKLTLSQSDSPVVLTPDDKPFIPGASFKGVLRSTVEKVIGGLPDSLGLRSCGLPTKEETKSSAWDDGYSCPTAYQGLVTKKKREARSPKEAQDIMNEVRERLCNTCQLFGSPYGAAGLMVNDLYLTNKEWNSVIQVRDGVAIDRDSETAKQGFKYDFEVVPSLTNFDMRLIIENATEQDLQLIGIGLGEFLGGFGGIGGLRSRGLGACILTDLKIRYLDLDESLGEAERRSRLQRYLVRKEMAEIEYQKFLDKYIGALFA